MHADAWRFMLEAGSTLPTLPGRQYLRSAGTNRLMVPPFKLSTIGTRAFPVASPGV